MFPGTMLAMLLMAGGMVAVLVSILLLTAVTLWSAQRRSWGSDRWAQFEREALHEALGRSAPRRAPALFRRRAA